MKSALNPVTRQRLEMQGFLGCSDGVLRALRPWLRVCPALLAIGMAAGLSRGSAAILWVLALFVALGTVLPTHPFDLPYNLVIRRWLGTPAIPSYGMPRRFGCFMATLWVSGTAVALGQRSGLAYVLGGIFLVPPILNVATDACIASMVYHRITKRWGWLAGRGFQSGLCGE